MSRSRRTFAVVLALMTLLVGLPLTAPSASALTPPATRYSALVQGDFTVAGNTLNQCCFSAGDEDANGGANPPASAADTNSSSRASFSMPAGATVTKAFLYTFVDYASTTAWPSTMKIAAPGGDYQDVAMTDLGNDQQGRVVYADVTSVLAGGGDGEVWVGSPNAFADADYLHAWGLYVVYSEPSLPWRQVVLVDQAAMIGFGATTTNATIPDLAVAPGGAADVTLAAFEFYSSSGGGQEDTLQICAGTAECADDPGSYADPSVYAQNVMNPAQDIANATFSSNGAPMPGTAPSPTVLWSDLDLFEMPGALPSGTTSATVTARSVSDTIFSGFVAVSTTVFAPIAQLGNSVSGVAAPAGYLDYELTYDLDNAGDDALDVVISDTLPGNVSYVPGSARVTSGANSGAKTDAAADDQVDVSGSNLTWRVGTGADSSVGGDVATTDGPQVLTFRVQVSGAATPGDPVTNTAAATFHGDRTPSLDYSATAVSTTPVVPIPSPPAPSSLTSSAAGPASQSASTSVPVGGSVMLLDGGSPVTSVTVTGGVYSVVPTTGVITFTPSAGYTGSPTPVAFRVTDSFAQSGDSTYAPTVTLPAAPNPTALTSSGTGTATQTATATVPTGATITLLDGTTPVTTLTVSGQGAYTLNPSTGIISFVPVLGFAGTPTAATYRITDGYAQSGSSTYTPTVNAPTPPVAGALTSSAPGPTVQTVTVSVPAAATVTLLDGSTPVTSLVRPGQGTYSLDPSTGVITFTPELGYAGTATAVSYRIEDAYAQASSSTYTPTVTTPSAPAPAALTSTAVGTATQTVTVSVPTGGTVELLDGATPVTTLTMPGEGTYVLDPATGTVTFTPLLGFIGAASPVTYRVTDSYAQSASSSYTPTVTTPAAPPALALTSSGTGTEAHRVTVVVPPGGAVTLLDGATPVTSLTVPGEGTHVLDPATGVITFTPQLGFAGTATAVGYSVTDAYAQTVSSTYTPAVTAPAPPAVTEPRSQGGPGQTQSVTIVVPPGGTITLLDGTTPVTTLTVSGQGTYTLDPATGTITFVPVAGFSGTPTPATYRVTDAYGQSTTGTYAPQVLGAEQVNAPGAPTPEAVPEATGATPSSLAFTGASPTSPLLLGALLLALGALVLAGRRRRARPTGPVS